MPEVFPPPGLAETLRRQDRPRFLLTLFAAPDLRADLTALYAFNLEVAKTRETVREPLLGRIRLEWWREAIEEIYEGHPRRHETVEALAATIRRHALPRAPFDRLIDAREADLEPGPFEDLAALTGYIDATSVALVALAARILGGDPPEAALSAAGRAHGFAGLLLAMAWRARHGRVDIPTEILAAHGSSAREILDGRPSDGLRATVGELAALAHGHLREATAAGRPRHLFPALGVTVMARRALGRLERVGGNPFDPSLARPDGLLPLELWIRYRLGQ